jgi:hypothetical protein
LYIENTGAPSNRARSWYKVSGWTVRAEELEKASPLELRALDDAELCDHDSPRKNRRSKQREQGRAAPEAWNASNAKSSAARGQKRGRKKRGRHEGAASFKGKGRGTKAFLVINVFQVISFSRDKRQPPAGGRFATEVSVSHKFDTSEIA